MRKRIVFAFLALAVTVSPALAQQTVDERRPAAADGVVTISNISGSVKVTGGSAPEIHVTGTLGRGIERLDFTVADRSARIKVVYPHDCRDCKGADLTITLPAGSRLEVRTVSAPIAVEQVVGAIDVEAVSGGVTISGSPAEVRAETVSGRIDVDAGPAPVEAKSVSGDVVLRGSAGRVRASTVSGDLQIDGGALERCDLGTVSGKVRLTAGLAASGRLEIETVSGAVDLALPAAPSADFSVETFSGDIENALGPGAERTSQYAPGKELHFTLGGGSGQIRIKTFSGSVRLGKS